MGWCAGRLQLQWTEVHSREGGVGSREDCRQAGGLGQQGRE